tara:strand:- start:1986 stop:3950 length:1965 start_codon:yes stop_codon:yes gene_type:complete
LKINYRPEIDGLRSIAVASVLLYHAQINVFDLEPFKGGFIGVDIFFVISGYLITSIIFKELTINNDFSFKNFYERRARRILPVLLFIILVAQIFAWIYLYPVDLISFSKSILYALGFSSNFYFHYSGLEYGSPEGLLKPFLHTWSLSVEEQYYVFFPLIFIVIFKYFRKYLLHFLLLGLITSLLLADWGSKNYPSSTFYFIHTRMWELIGGSLLAYFEIKLGRRGQNNNWQNFFSFLGFLLIGYAIFFYNDKIFHPSFYTVIPITGVILILWFANKSDIITKILSYKLFVGVGLISYSLYLWHYTVFSFAKNLEIFFDDGWGKLFLIAISIILSIFTYFFIEQPARKNNSFKLVFSFLLVATFIILAFNITVIIKDGFLNRLKVKNYQEKHSYMYLIQENKPCFNRVKNLCNFGSHKKKIILLGDSHMGSLAYDLYDKTKLKYSYLPLTFAGYFHLSETKQINKKTKKNNNGYDNIRNNVNKILNKSNNNIIIIGGVYSLYFYNKRIEGRALHWDNMFVDKVSDNYDSKIIENDFIALIKKLSINNEVIILYPIPEIGVNLQKKKFENMVRVFDYKYSDFLKQNKEVINFLDTINYPKVHKVFPHKAFCKEGEKLCTTHDKDNFFFYDGYHPSIIGSKMINNLIIKKIDLLDQK